MAIHFNKIEIISAVQSNGKNNSQNSGSPSPGIEIKIGVECPACTNTEQIGLCCAHPDDFVFVDQVEVHCFCGKRFFPNVPRLRACEYLQQYQQSINAFMEQKCCFHGIEIPLDVALCLKEDQQKGSRGSEPHPKKRRKQKNKTSSNLLWEGYGT